MCGLGVGMSRRWCGQSRNLDSSVRIVHSGLGTLSVGSAETLCAQAPHPITPATRAGGDPVAPDMNGRVTGVYVHIPVSTEPIICLSVYLLARKGTQQANRELLADVSSQFVGEQRGPFLVGGDFQEHPLD